MSRLHHFSSIIFIFFSVTLFCCGDMGTRGGNPLTVPLDLSFNASSRVMAAPGVRVKLCFQAVSYIYNVQPAFRFYSPLWPDGKSFVIENEGITTLYQGSVELQPGIYNAVGFEYSNQCEHSAEVINSKGIFQFDNLGGEYLVFNFYRNVINISDQSLKIQLKIDKLLALLAQAETKDDIKNLLTLPGGYEQ